MGLLERFLPAWFRDKRPAFCVDCDEDDVAAGDEATIAKFQNMSVRRRARVVRVVRQDSEIELLYPKLGNGAIVAILASDEHQPGKASTARWFARLLNGDLVRLVGSALPDGIDQREASSPPMDFLRAVALQEHEVAKHGGSLPLFDPEVRLFVGMRTAPPAPPTPPTSTT